jgi:amino acid transporter
VSTVDIAKRMVVGRPLRSDRMGETLLPKWLALPVFCSDPLSSVAYATEAILAILAYGGVRQFYGNGKYLAAAVVFLLVIVTLSYRQTVYAYPNGGGAYVVSSKNLGPTAGLIAASALLVDYVMTVTVSVAAGVAAITSAAPSMSSVTVEIAVGFVVLIAVLNLRGVKESGKAFAIPTYGFVIIIYVMFAWAAYKLAFTHEHFEAVSAHYQTVKLEKTGGAYTVFLLLRAFANGCTALTGVEAVSNGVPAFRKPKSKNAAGTLGMMAFFAVTMFVGITALALRAHVHSAETQSVFGKPESTYKSSLAQIGIATFGNHSIGFLLLTIFTCGILVLAANTAFNGFPVLASILAADQYLPRQLRSRGDRLVFSNGVVILAVFSCALLAGFGANVAQLLQLYIIGVFVSFTLSQLGMVRHWQSLRGISTDRTERRSMMRSQTINSIGAASTALVLVIVILTKFTHGAWIAVTAMVVIFFMMKAIHRHYETVARELAAPMEQRLVLPSRVHAIVLVSKIHQPTLRALAYAKASRPFSLEAVTVAVDDSEVAALQQEWDERGLAAIPLRLLSSPFRELTKPIVDYVTAIRRESPRDVVAVYVPEYVVGHWWEHLLHNQTPLRVKARLLFQPGVLVISVPFQLRSSHALMDVEPVRQPAQDPVAEAPQIPVG